MHMRSLIDATPSLLRVTLPLLSILLPPELTLRPTSFKNHCDWSRIQTFQTDSGFLKENVKLISEFRGSDAFEVFRHYENLRINT